MNAREENELIELTERICNLTISKESRVIKDGSIFVPEDGTNAAINTEIRQLRSRALLIRGAPGSIGELSFMSNEGRED